MKKAFTLAEVLITLGIIGVVAALVMPSLISNYKKQETVSRLKKGYNTLSNALRLSEVDNGDYETWDIASDIGVQNYFDKYWKPYLKTAQLCTTTNRCGYSSDQYSWRYRNSNTNNMLALDNTYGTSFKFMDGIFVCVRAFSGSSVSSSLIFIDINGAKGPNVLGTDVFQFNRISPNGVVPNGYDQTDAYVNDNCANVTGEYCAAKIMRDGWVINYDLNKYTR